MAGRMQSSKIELDIYLIKLAESATQNCPAHAIMTIPETRCCSESVGGGHTVQTAAAAAGVDQSVELQSKESPPHKRSPVSHAGQPHPGTHGRGIASYSHAWTDKTEENADNLIGKSGMYDFPVGPY